MAEKSSKQGFRKIQQRAIERRRQLSQPPIQRTDRQQRHDSNHPVPWGVRSAAAWSWRFLVIAAAAGVIFWVLGVFKLIVLSLLVAALLTVLVEPAMRLCRSTLRMPRALAAAITLIGFILVVVGLVGGAGASMVAGFQNLKGKARDGFDTVIDWLANGPLQIDSQQLDNYVQQVEGKLQDNANTIVGGVMSATSGVVTMLTGLVLALFCMFFFLKDGRRMWHYTVRLFPSAARRDVNEAGIRAWKTLGAYTRTQIQVALIDAVGIAVVALVLGVPLWFPIGVLVFVGAFIPIVGAFVTGAIACLVALVDQGPSVALLMMLGVLVVQQVESNVLQPFLQGTQLSLHPVVVVLAVAAGSGLAGIFGAMFAVPLVAMTNVGVNYLAGKDMYPELSHDPNRPGGPPDALEAAFAQRDEEFAKRAEVAAEKAGDTEEAEAKAQEKAQAKEIVENRSQQ